MKYILVNYNYTPEWLKDYTEDYLIYDRSDSKEFLKDFDQSKIVYTKNLGNVDYDKLTYLVDHYDNLPECFVWGKTNLFKYISVDEFDEVKTNTHFTPLLTKGHKTYSDRIGQVCYYQGEMYYERNDSWYLQEHTSKYFKNWQQWAQEFLLPNPRYIPFAPGGNYILTREIVHKYSKDFYDKMRSLMLYSQLPGEAQLAERSYYLMWK